MKWKITIKYVGRDWKRVTKERYGDWHACMDLIERVKASVWSMDAIESILIERVTHPEGVGE